MLGLLGSASSGPVPSAEVEAVLKARGTALIVAQQNISRAVSMSQYRVLLEGLHRSDPPEIVPIDGSERARRGADGLRNDVWPGLRWGIANLDTLRRRVAELQSLDLEGEARMTALSFLPESVPINADVYVVLGGRAGASVVEGNVLFVDVLALSLAAERAATRYSPDPAFFAHEMHHIGLAQVVDRAWRPLVVAVPVQRALRVLRFLALEGSATYLINAHRNMAELGDSGQSAGLMKAVEGILASALDVNTESEAFEKALTPLIAGGFHFAGAVMFGRIDREMGLEAVMSVLRDPRRMLLAYNQALARGRGERNPPFDTALAQRLSVIGQ